MRSGPRHANRGFELSWVERGVVEFEVAGRRIAVAERACVIIPPGIEHTPRAVRAAMRQLTLPVSLVEDSAAALASQPPREIRVFDPRAPLSTFGRFLERATGELAIRLLADAALVAMLLPSTPPRREARTPRVKRAVERMREELAEPLRIGQIASEGGMDRWTFGRLFRAQLGESPQRFLTRTRLEAAATMLRETDDSILSIALRCGLSDPSRFARSFRALYGCTPRAYRRGG